MSVALSFDDGPGPSTAAVLAALGGTRATFFVMGSAVERFPAELQATLDAGHDVQLHCHEHRRHTELSREELVADTEQALAVLGAHGVVPTRWRTPWGVLGPETGSVAASFGLELTHWTADTEDWAGEPAAALLARVADGLVPGAIVLAHDGVGPGALREDCSETAALVPLLVDAIRAAGLEPGPLPAPGVAP